MINKQLCRSYFKFYRSDTKCLEWLVYNKGFKCYDYKYFYSKLFRCSVLIIKNVKNTFKFRIFLVCNRSISHSQHRNYTIGLIMVFKPSLTQFKAQLYQFVNLLYSNLTPMLVNSLLNFSQISNMRMINMTKQTKKASNFKTKTK